MDGVHATDGRLGSRSAAEDDVEAAGQRAHQAPERICGVGGVLDHAGGDHWVRRLHQQCARSTGQYEHLAVDAPGDASRTEEAARLLDGAHRKSEAGVPRGWRGSWKMPRKKIPASSPATKPPMCAMYATPPVSAATDAAPMPLMNWKTAHIPIATMAGTGS